MALKVSHVLQMTYSCIAHDRARKRHKMTRTRSWRSYSRAAVSKEFESTGRN